MAVKSLQIAVTEFLQEKFNKIYKDLSGDTLDLYKFSTIIDWNFDEFKHYDSDGKLVVNKYNFHDIYVSAIVDGLIGDVEQIPGSFVVNANIPITLVTPLFKEQDGETINFVDYTLMYVNEFLKSSIGQIYELDFKDNDSEDSPKYKIAFAVSLPDYSELQDVQGEMYKSVSFDLSCVISNNIYWGNDIKYELSYNDGAEGSYIPLVKIEPSTSKNKDLYSNQIIGKDYAQSSVRSAIWQKSMTILGQNNKICEYLIKYVDFGYSEFDIEKPNWKLKIIYNLFNNQIIKEKPVIIDEVSYSDDIGDFITISFTMVDKF